jgi:hypothetical protein
LKPITVQLCLMLLLELCHCRLARASDCNTKVDADRSLLITNLSVVNDRRSQNGGPWSFEAIFKQAVGEAPNPGVAAYDWLHQFSSKRSYNGYDLPDRSSGPLFAIWPITTSDSSGNVSLDLTKNPMTLLAIVFRTDIVNENFGEGRFVFGVTDPIKGPQDMTVIFEFLMQRTPNLPTKKAWYQAIADLSKLENGEAYNRALHRLTAEFTYPYSGSTQLRRLRTNDQFFGQGWDMREFRYDRRERRLMMTAVEKTPDFSLNSEIGNELTSWILENRETIIDGNYQLPGKFASGSGFLLDDTFSWFARNPNLDGELRRHFAVNTCSGCHGRATKTAFLHLSPRALTEESKRSDHLTQDLIKRKTQLQDFICGQ